MSWQYSPHAVALFITASIALMLAFYSWGRRIKPVGTYIALLMFAVAEWALTSGLEFLAVEIPAKVIWSKFQYLGIVSIAPLWILFALSYAGQSELLSRGRPILLWVVPVIILGLTATNEWHGLIWPRITPLSDAPGARLVYDHGPGVWITLVYSYSLLLLGTVWFIKTAFRSHKLFRRQTIILLIGALVPWAGNAVYLSGLSPFPGVDVTPFAFTVTGLMMTYSLFRFQLLNMLPVAHGALVQSMSDGIAVLDSQNRIVDINPAARRLIGAGPAIIGRLAREALASWPDIIKRYKDTTEAREEILFTTSEGARWLEVRISPVHDRRGQLTGRLIVLRDINERKLAEKSLFESESRYRSLFEHSPVALWEQDYSGVKDRIDELRRSGVDEVAAYLQEHPEFVRNAVSQVRILGVNAAAARLYEADSPHQLLHSLAHVFSEKSYDLFREVMTCIAQGRTFLSGEDRNRTLLGRPIDVLMTWSAAPGHEARYDRIYVSNLDITEIKKAEEAIASSEERFRALVQNSYDLIVVLDPESVVIYESPSAERALGYTVRGKKAFDLIHPDDLPAVRKRLEEVMENISAGAPSCFRIRRLDGTWIQVEAIGKNLLETPGIRGLFITARDITWRKQAESELRKNEELYSKLIATLPDIIIITDIQGNIRFINDYGVRLSGFATAAGLSGKSIFSFIAPEDLARAVLNARLMLEKTMPPAEYNLINKDGQLIPFEVNGEVLRDLDGTPNGIVFACRDITERRQAEAALRATVREKDVLLKELHHRVKNNMQVISSLLHHQARTIKDPDVLELFQESQNRIRSMALVHEKLYRSQDLSGIDFAEYIHGLVVQLFRAHQTRTGLIEFEPDLEKALLNINTAIPLGLIINELVMNVLKHAFPDGRRGVLRIKLARADNQKFLLVVKDTGVGFPEDFDFRKTETLGMQIVTMLVDQIGGTVAMERNGGTEFRIIFGELKDKLQS